MDDTNAGKSLSAWLGTYTTDTKWWGPYFSPLVVQLDGTVTLCGEPMLYSYDAGKVTLTIPKQPWNAQNKDKSDGTFCGCTVTFSATETPEGIRGSFTGVLQPRPQDGNVPFTGAAPVTTQYKASSADVKAIATAYGVAMDDATCDALAAALPAFPPPPQSAASPRMAASAQIGWKTGAFIGGIIGGILGGIAGSIAGPAGIVAGAGAGVAVGANFGAGLAYPEDPQQVISGVEHESEHGCCVDVSKETYPVGWIPWVGDLKSWRSYDPTTIPGVGILVRSAIAPNGTKQLIGKNLMTKEEEVLVDHGDGGHYSWVFHPSQAIIYKWNSGEAIKKGDYIRHSQLAGGVPVICGGEWTLEQGQLGIMIATINDASGHYKPDGGKCMGPVLTKLELLGVNTAPIKVNTM